MEYEDLTKRLLADVPQIKPYYEEEIEWLEEDLPHVIFGMVVTPFIIKLHDEEIVGKSIFDFLEEMALGDERFRKC